MKSPPISNVKIEFSSLGSKTLLGWEAEGFAFHVWSSPRNDAPWEVNDGTVYKRSLEAIANDSRTDRVRQLDATSRPCRSMLAMVGHIALRDGLLELAQRKLEDQLHNIAREKARRDRVQRLCDDARYRDQALALMERDGDAFCSAIAKAWRHAPAEYLPHLERGFAGLLEQFTTDREAA